MLPAASFVGVAVKTSHPVTALTSQRAAQPQAPETARASAGEAAAANVRAETPSAIQAAEQSAVAPRLRDQETADRSERSVPGKDTPTGPPPSFEESPLERQARVAFDPPEATPPPVPEAAPVKDKAIEAPDDHQGSEVSHDAGKAPIDPPPTPTERAEVSFAETRTLATAREPATVDFDL